MDRLSPAQRSRLMGRVRSKNTKPELTVRRLVYGMGFRYRLHDRRLPGCPDLVFRSRRSVVFVNGCFWHGHAGCRYARTPKTREEFWQSKVERNRARDARSVALLEADGWKVLTVWQCELKDLQALEKRLHDFFDLT